MSYAPLDDSRETDPYEIAKSKIHSRVEEFMSNFDNWKDLLENTNTAQSREFVSLTDTLKAEYKQLSKALKKIEKESVMKLEEIMLSVGEAESGVSRETLDQRRRFIADMQLAIVGCRDTIVSVRTREIIARHKRETLASTALADSESVAQRAARRGNDEFLGGHMEMKQKEREKQDEVLGDMLHTIQRLGVHGGLIVNELEEQNVLLEEVHSDMDTAKDRLNRLGAKLDVIMKHSEGKKMCLIVILVIVLILLIYFMF